MALAGNLQIQMQLDIARLTQDIAAAKSVVSNGMDAITRSVESTKRALELFGVAFTVHEITEKISSVIEGMAKLRDAAEKTGASIENLSKLQFFAGVSGSSIDGVTSALAKLSKGMAGAGNDTAATSQALKFLGLSAKDAQGNLKDPAALFGEISKTLIQYQDGAGKAAIAQALFGKAGAEMLPTLKKMAELGDIEAGVTKQQAAAAEAYEIEVARLNQKKQILWNTVSTALLPTMQMFVEMLLKASTETGSLGNTVKGFAADHSIEDWADAGARGVAILIDAFKALPKIFTVVTAEITAAIGFVDVLLKAKTMTDPGAAAAAILTGRNPVTEFTNSISAMKLAQADADRAMKDFMGSEFDGTQKSMDRAIALRKANAMDAARDAEGGSGGAEAGKALNFSLGDAAKAAAELKLYISALQKLEQENGKLQNQTEVEKLSFELYGKAAKDAFGAPIMDADGKVVHLSGSLEKLTGAHGRQLLIIAAENDIRKQWLQISDAALKSAVAQTAEQDRSDAALGSYNQTLSEQLQQLQFEGTLIGKLDLQREQAIALRALDLDYAKKVAAADKEENVNREEELTTLKMLYDAQSKSLPALMALNKSGIELDQKKLDQLQFEITLIGMDTTAREQAIAVRALELTGINQNTEAFQAYVEKLKGAIAEKNFAEANKSVLVGIWQDVDRAGADAFQHIGDKGVDQLQRIKDELKNGLLNLLYQMTLRPFLVQVVTSTAGSGVAQQVFGAAATSGNSGNSLLNFLSTGKSAFETVTGQNSTLNSALNFLGIGPAAAGAAAGTFGTLGAAGLTTGATVGGFAGSIAPSLFATVPAAEGAAGGAALFGTLAPATEGVIGGAIGSGVGATAATATATSLETASLAGGGLAAGAATAIPYIGAAIAIAYALGVFGKGSTPAVGTGYHFKGAFDPTDSSVQDFFAGGNTNKATDEALTGQDVQQKLFADAIAPAFDEFTKLAKSLGLDASVIGKTAFDIQTGAIGQAADDASKPAAAAQLLNEWALQLLPNIKDLSQEGEATIQTFVRLKSEMDLTDKLIEIMGKTSTQAFGSVGTASLEMRDKLVELLGGLDKAAALTADYYTNFYTDTERQAADLKLVDDAMRELGLTTIPTTRAQFRALIEAQDTTTKSGQEMFAALMQLESAFASVTAATVDTTQSQTDLLNNAVSKWGDVAKTLRDYAASLFGAPASGSSYAEALQQFTSVSTRSRLGDIDAATQLRDVSEAFRQASLLASSTQADYIRDLAKIQSAVNGTISTADQQVTIAQKQLDELRNISSILGGVPGHASGGMASGWSWTGEHGPELQYYGSPTRIFSNADSRAMFAGGSDNDAMLAAVRDELSGMRQEMRSGIGNVVNNTRQSSRLARKADVDAQPVDSASVTAVNSSATSRQLVASNAARRGLTLFNTDDEAAYIKYGQGASLTSFKVRMRPNAYWEMPEPIYTGQIDVIWAAGGGGGKMVVTET